MDWSLFSDKAILIKIGQFVQSTRVNQGQSQELVSKAAGISRSTLSLLERGEKVRIDSLIQVLRVLNVLNVLDKFEVNDQIGPVEYAKLKRKQRQKAPRRYNTNDSSPNMVQGGSDEDLGW